MNTYNIDKMYENYSSEIERMQKCIDELQQENEKLKADYGTKVQVERDLLKEENKILKENSENNDKVVDKVNWENQLLKKENKQLKDNWNKLKDYIVKEYYIHLPLESSTTSIIILINKMQELEQGSDINE